MNAKFVILFEVARHGPPHSGAIDIKQCGKPWWQVTGVAQRLQANSNAIAKSAKQGSESDLKLRRYCRSRKSHADARLRARQSRVAVSRAATNCLLNGLRREVGSVGGRRRRTACRTEPPASHLGRRKRSKEPARADRREPGVRFVTLRCVAAQNSLPCCAGSDCSLARSAVAAFVVAPTRGVSWTDSFVLKTGWNVSRWLPRPASSTC